MSESSQEGVNENAIENQKLRPQIALQNENPGPSGQAATSSSAGGNEQITKRIVRPSAYNHNKIEIHYHHFKLKECQIPGCQQRRAMRSRMKRRGAALRRLHARFEQPLIHRPCPIVPRDPGNSEQLSETEDCRYGPCALCTAPLNWSETGVELRREALIAFMSRPTVRDPNVSPMLAMTPEMREALLQHQLEQLLRPNRQYLQNHAFFWSGLLD